MFLVHNCFIKYLNKYISLCFRCRKVLQTASCEKKIYNMNDELLSKLSILKPQNVLSLAYLETYLTLLPLIKVVPRFNKLMTSGEITNSISKTSR